jgi:hypothetical protein
MRYLAKLGIRSPWDMGLVLAFIVGSASWAVIALLRPDGLGTHGAIYAEAAAAWLRGADPWLVGPPAAVYAGPPTMLLPFVPFASLPWDVTRLAWFAIDVVLAVWVLRRLAMPAYWLAFPPMFSAIVLGHIELVVLALIVIGGAASGLAAVIKPYSVFPLLAERRWRALLVAVAAVVVTAPFLPWAQFLGDAKLIGETLARQNIGDAIVPLGGPIPVAVAIVALAALGPRRALWLAAPVLWPFSQPIYKAMTLPVLTPVLAIFWALPVAGATLVGLVVFAVLVIADRRRRLPAWLREGILPVATPRDSEPSSEPLPLLGQPAAA